MGRLLFLKGESGNPRGRPRGAQGKVTREVKEWARGLLEDPEYRDALQRRLIDGTCPPQLEVLLYHYAYGKPVDVIAMANAEKARDYAQEQMVFEEQIAKLLGSPASAEPEPPTAPSAMLRKVEISRTRSM